MVTERIVLITGSEDPTFLEQRYHLSDEHIEHLRQRIRRLVNLDAHLGPELPAGISGETVRNQIDWLNSQAQVQGHACCHPGEWATKNSEPKTTPHLGLMEAFDELTKII